MPLVISAVDIDYTHLFYQVVPFVKGMHGDTLDIQCQQQQW